MASARRLFFDLETEPITPGNRLPRPVVCGLRAEGESDVRIVRGTRAILETLERALRDDLVLYAHNGAHFDFAVCVKWSEQVGSQGPRFWTDAAHRDKLVCTSIAAQMVDISQGPSKRDWYPLERVCRDYGVTVPLDKQNPWRTRYAELEHVSIEHWPLEAIAYLRGDVDALHDLAMRLPLPPDVHRKTEQHLWLELSSARGAPIHTQRAIAWGNSLRAQANELASVLRAAKLIDETGSKNMKAARVAICGLDTSELSEEEIEILDKELAAKPPKGLRMTKPSTRFPQGQISVDAIACEDSDAPLMVLLSAYNGIQSTLSRELPTVMHGRVHTRYGMADTFRTTSSDPALQNLGTASGARECFVAEEGKHLAIADWTMLELCCLGQICVELRAGNKLATALREGRDVHHELAQRLAQAGAFGDDPKRLRRLAKEANFGRGGGMGAATLIATARKRGLVFDLPTAKNLIAVHSAQWPEIPIYHRMVQDHIEQSGGRITHYRTGAVRGGLRFTQAANSPFQTLGANVALTGFVETSRAGFMPQLFVHDEYHWSLAEPGETETLRDILMRVSRDWLSHCPSKIDPVIVPDWSKKK